jgi:hypothetical protein
MQQGFWRFKAAGAPERKAAIVSAIAARIRGAHATRVLFAATRRYVVSVVARYQCIQAMSS